MEIDSLIDYDRKIALVAIQKSQADEKILGVARVISRVDRKQAEFSIGTGDPWQGKRIGAKLLRRCLTIVKKTRHRNSSRGGTDEFEMRLDLSIVINVNIQYVKENLDY